MPKFGTENGFIWYFWPKMPYLGIFDQEFQKNFAIFEISALKLALLQNLVQKIKILKFGTKNALFGYFWARIWKWYCHIWNQHPRICLIAKFCKKTKTPKFGTKNALLGYFWAAILKNNCHIWNKQLLNLPNCKISWNNENA